MSSRYQREKARKVRALVAVGLAKWGDIQPSELDTLKRLAEAAVEVLEPSPRPSKRGGKKHG